MMTLLTVGLSNAGLASVLAALAWVAGRRKFAPGLVHPLWVLVLVKLVTPPLVPLPVLPAATEAPPPATAPPPPAPVEVAVSLAPAPPVAPTRMTLLVPKMLLDPGTGTPVFVPAVAEDDAAPAPALQTTVTFEYSPPPTPAPPAPAPAPPARSPWMPVVVGVWLAGSAVWFAIAGVRVLRFHRLLRNASDAPASLQKECDALARRLGLARVPPLRLVPGRVSPLVWAFGPAVVYFPAGLLESLGRQGREALLAHELAHVHRRDHWVRWLELLAAGLYWWLPVVWWARRGLHEAEEQCCDAKVLEVLPAAGRSYAVALLDTLDFLADAPALPAAASGIGGVTLIKRRLQLILAGPNHIRSPWRGRLALALLALGVLPLAPILAEREAPRPPSPVADAANLTTGPAARPEEDAFLFEARPSMLQANDGWWWQAVVAPDGKTLAVAHGREEGGTLRVHDIATGELLRSAEEPGGTRCVAFSPDGSLIATGNFDNILRVYDAATLRLRFASEKTAGHAGGVNALCFAADGNLLFTAGLDRVAMAWDLAGRKGRPGGEAVAIRPAAIFKGHGASLFGIAASPDGKRLVTGCQDGTARLWDVPAAPKPGDPPVAVAMARAELKGHTAAVECVAAAPDGKGFATGSWDNTIKLWNADGVEQATIPAHDQGVMALAFSPDGQQLVSACGIHDSTTPGAVKVWDVAGRKEVTGYQNPAGPVRGACFTPDGKAVVSTGVGRAARFCSAVDGKEIRVVRQPQTGSGPQAWLAAVYSPVGGLLATAGEGKDILLWDVAHKEPKATLTGHGDVVSGLAFSPDGALLASCSHDKTVRLWDVKTGKELRTLTGHTNQVFAVAFATDGRTVASGSYDKTIRLWDARTGETKATLRGHTAAVRSLAFGPENLLVSGSSDRTVRTWDTAAGKETATLRGHKGAVRAVAVTADGRRVASGGEDQVVRLWDLNTGKESAVSAPAGDIVECVVFSPQGTLVVAGTFSGLVHQYDGLTARGRGTLATGKDAVMAVAISPDGQAMASAGYDKNVRLWPPTPPPPPPLRRYAHGAAVTAVAGTADGRLAATAGADGIVRVWDVGTGREAAKFNAGVGIVNTIAFVGTDRLAVAGAEKTAKLWDFATSKAVVEYAGHGGAVRSLAVSPDRKSLATGSADKLVRVFETETGKEVKRFEGHGAAVTALAWSPDSKLLASGGDEAHARIWDVAAGKVKSQTPPGPLTGRVAGLIFATDGQSVLGCGGVDGVQVPVVGVVAQPQYGLARINVADGQVTPLESSRHPAAIVGFAFTEGGVVTACRDGVVRFWDAGLTRVTREVRASRGELSALALVPAGVLTGGDDQAGKLWPFDGAAGSSPRAVLPSARGQVLFAAFSRDGRFLATGGEDSLVRLRAGVPGRQKPVEGPVRATYGAAFSPDGKLLASAHEDGTVRLTDPATGRLVRKLEAHGERVWSVAFSPDGKTLASVSGDWFSNDAGEVKLWDAATGKLLHTLEGHADLVWSVAFSPDGKLLATASRDRTARVWDAATGKALHTLTGHTEAVRSVSFAPDGTLATAGFDSRVLLWDALAGRQTAARAFAGKPLSRAVYSPDGKTLAVAYNPESAEGRAGKVLLLDASTGKELRTLAGHAGEVNEMAWSGDSRVLVTSGGRYAAFGEVHAWDAATGERLADLSGHRHQAEALAFSRDGRFLASGGATYEQPGELRLWDATGLRPAVILDGHARPVTAAAFSPDGTLLATASADETAIVWDLRLALDPRAEGNRRVRLTLKGHARGVRAVCWSPDGKSLATAGEDGRVRLWDVATGKELQTVTAAETPVCGLAWSPDGKTLATAAGDATNRKPGEVALWDASTLGRKAKAALPESAWSVVFTPDGSRLVTSQQGDGSVKVWNAATLTEERTLPGMTSGRCLAASPEGRMIVCGGGEVIRTWETGGWREAGTLTGTKPGIISLTFAPDGRTLAAAGGPSTLIFDMGMPGGVAPRPAAK